MIGFSFSKFEAEENNQTPFERLLKLFLELMVYTAGDVEETFDWMKQLDQEHHITDDDYTLEDFRKDLEKRSMIRIDPKDSKSKITSKTEQMIRKRALDQIFGKLKKGTAGNHPTTFIGKGEEMTEDSRPFQFGDPYEHINFTESLRNAQINHGIDQFKLTQNDLEIQENRHKTQLATVLMIDISHSMILYGEDRITPAKKVAMALAEFITSRYPKDTLDIVVFGNDAWQVQIKDLPYLTVGPYHTNTVAGLELAMDLLRRKKKR